MSTTPQPTEPFDRGPADSQLSLIDAAAGLRGAAFDALQAALAREGFSDIAPAWAVALSRLDPLDGLFEARAVNAAGGDGPGRTRRRLVERGYLRIAERRRAIPGARVMLAARGIALARFVRDLAASRSWAFTDEIGGEIQECFTAAEVVRTCAVVWRDSKNGPEPATGR